MKDKSSCTKIVIVELLTLLCISGSVLAEGIISEQEIIDKLKPEEPMFKERGISAGGGIPAVSGSLQTAGQIPETTSTSNAVNMRTINFEYNSSRLTSQAKIQLDELGSALQSPELVQYNFLVEGHTDASGTTIYNQQLSESRARAVKQYLTSVHAINAHRLQAIGRGESDLYDPENKNSAANRRVQIVTMQ